MCCPPNNQYPESNKDLEEPKEPKIIEGKLMGVQSNLSGDFYIILANGVNEVQEVGVSPTMQSNDPMTFYLTHRGRKVYKVSCSICKTSFWRISFPPSYEGESFICGPCKKKHDEDRGIADGKRGYPPQEEEGDYFEGYKEGYRKFILGCLRGNKKRPEIIRYSD